MEEGVLEVGSGCGSQGAGPRMVSGRREKEEGEAAGVSTNFQQSAAENTSKS